MRFGPGFSAWATGVASSVFVVVGLSMLLIDPGGDEPASTKVMGAVALIGGAWLIWREMVWVSFSSDGVRVWKAFAVKRYPASEIVSWDLGRQGVLNNQVVPILVMSDGSEVKLESLRMLGVPGGGVERLELALALLELEE